MSSFADFAALHRVTPLWIEHRRRIAQGLALFCVASLMCAAVLSPPLIFSDAFPYLKAEQALIPLVIVVYGWLLLAGYARPIRLNAMFAVGAAYVSSILLSAWYGAAVLHHPVIPRDFYEIPKALFPVVFFVIAYEADLSERSLRRVVDFLGVAILLVCIYAWAQFADLAVSHVLDGYYSAGPHVDAALRNVGRVYSTMGNPNVLGALMSWSIVIFTTAALFNLGSPVRCILLAFACVVTLAMTGSRYGLLTSGLGLLLIFVLPSSSARRRVAQIGFLLSALVLFSWAFTIAAKSDRGLLQRFETLNSPLQTDSVRERLDNLWLDAIADFKQSPWLGYGPAKILFTGIVTDSEYLDVLKEFGILGFLSYILFFIVPLVQIWSGLRTGWREGPTIEERLPGTFVTLRVSFAIIITALVMNVGGATFYNQLVQAFVWLWLGLGVRCARSIKDNSRNWYPLASSRSW